MKTLEYEDDKKIAHCLVSNKGELKRLAAILTLTFVFFGCNWRRISLLGPRLSMTSTARAMKLDEKLPQLFNQSFKVKFMPLVIYGRKGVHAHIHARTHRRMHAA